LSNFSFDHRVSGSLTPIFRYLISSTVLTPVKHWIKQDLCTTAMLRATNIAFATGILVVVSRLLKLLHPGTDSTRLILYALALGCFPVSMFYTFLYYTDSGSTFFVLLSYLLSKQRRYIMSGLVRH
jgi:alpha-1,2-glucosyltransferase